MRRFLLVAALALAAWATVVPQLPAWLARTSAAAAPNVPVPLAGYWQTLANGDRVNRILRDGNSVWVATEGGGLILWNIEQKTFQQFLAPQDGLLSNDVNDLDLASDGSLWIATNRGLSYLNALTGEITNTTPANSPGMPSRVATALEVLDDGRVWVGFAQEWDPTLVNDAAKGANKPLGAFKKGGLALYDPVQRVWSQLQHVDMAKAKEDKFEAIPSENITDLALSTTGILWVGTRQFYIYDLRDCGDETCPPGTEGHWVLAGGGLGAYQNNKWSVMRANKDTGSQCYSNTITSLRADVNGRMWVGTLGQGLLMMDRGMQKASCTSQICYKRPRKRDNGGMRSNFVFGIDIDKEGRVWAAQGEDYKTGFGVSILGHNNTFSTCDTSNPASPAGSGDDSWEYVDWDGTPGKTDAVISALDARQAGQRIFGSKDNRLGDGFGLRMYDDATQTWTPMVTAGKTIPSNHVNFIKHDKIDNSTWFSFAHRGIARFDGLNWQWWRAFVAGTQVAKVAVTTKAGYARVTVDIPNQAAFDAAFPPNARYCRIGIDPTMYRIKRYIVENKGVGPFIELSEDLIQDAKADTGVFVIDRGVPSNVASQIDVGADGKVWAGGHETMWQVDSQGDCPTFPNCYLDGGLGKYDGGIWTIYDIDSTGTPPGNRDTGIPDQEVLPVQVDNTGKVWVGSSNGTWEDQPWEGHGLGVLDPVTGAWVRHDTAALTKVHQSFAGDGVSDIDIDTTNNNIWTTHHYIRTVIANPFGGGSKTVNLGGGVSHWNGTRWESWSKKPLTGTSTLKGFGEYGELRAVKVDRAHNLIWAGGWDQGSTDYHWPRGEWLYAVLNWCPLDSCTNMGWQNKVWPDDGMVTAIAQDDTNNIWVTVSRAGAGLIPPEGGVKVYDGTNWVTYTPENSGLVARELTALEPDADNMWVGSFNRGVSYYKAIAPPTPTPKVTNTPRPTLTPRPIATEEGGDEFTPTPPSGTVVATPTDTATAPATAAEPPTPTPTATRKLPPNCKNAPERCVFIHLPYLDRCIGRPSCPRIRPRPLVATATRPTPTSSAATATPAATTLASATPNGLDTPPATPTATDIPTVAPATAVPSTATPSGPPTATPTGPPTRTPTRTPTAPATAIPTTPPTRTWSVYDPQNKEIARDIKLSGVFGFKDNSVWLVGDQAHVYYWDGSQMYSQQLATQENFVSGYALSAARAYVVGANGAAFETRTGGANGAWRKLDTGSFTDDWSSICVIQTAMGIRGWLLGSNKGTRAYFDGTAWSPQSPDDRNSNAAYSDVVMLDATTAYATIGGTSGGARIYSWNGTKWDPGTATGPMYDLSVKSPTAGIAVGLRGTIWQLGADGKWASMASKPSTSGQDLFAVHMIAPDSIWAGGGRGGLYYWDGIRWTTVPVTGVSTRTIHGIWIAPDGKTGWAVGDNGLVLQYK